jgi:hypothetical protein
MTAGCVAVTALFLVKVITTKNRMPTQSVAEPWAPVVPAAGTTPATR